MTPDVIVVSAPTPTRGPAGLINERAPLEMVDMVYGAVSEPPWHESAFHCSMVPSARCCSGRCLPCRGSWRGWPVFIDGHEDATPMEDSTSGDAANMEMAFLYGLLVRADWSGRAGAAAAGPWACWGRRRSSCWDARRAVSPPSWGADDADRVRLRPATELHEDPADAGRRAAERVAAQASGWWLHIDLDVLDREEFSACGAVGDPAMAGGLSWSEPGAVAASALGVGGACGWSLGVYNPDLDPQRRAANESCASWPMSHVAQCDL